MRNDFCTGYLAHSYKGSTWKDHKYIRKEGKKYIYKETRKMDDGTSWDIYENEETGETLRKNNNFTYNPERTTKEDFKENASKSLKQENNKYVKPLTGDEKERTSQLISEGEKLIDDILNPEKKKLAKK